MEKVKTQENGATPIQPWQIQTLVDKRTWDYLPVLYEALKEVNEEQKKIGKRLTKIEKLLKEK